LVNYLSQTDKSVKQLCVIGLTMLLSRLPALRSEKSPESCKLSVQWSSDDFAGASRNSGKIFCEC